MSLRPFGSKLIQRLGCCGSYAFPLVLEEQPYARHGRGVAPARNAREGPDRLDAALGGPRHRIVGARTLARQEDPEEGTAAGAARAAVRRPQAQQGPDLAEGQRAKGGHRRAAEREGRERSLVQPPAERPLKLAFNRPELYESTRSTTTSNAERCCVLA